MPAGAANISRTLKQLMCPQMVEIALHELPRVDLLRVQLRESPGFVGWAKRSVPTIHAETR
jgi:hypothetical protein